ncbi:Cytochrome P450 1A2 [Manis pentadactyla]|nr:Cytochrome P450 1A2 [Manis pentadactyla]
MSASAVLTHPTCGGHSLSISQLLSRTKNQDDYNMKKKRRVNSELFLFTGYLLKQGALKVPPGSDQAFIWEQFAVKLIACLPLS